MVKLIQITITSILITFSFSLLEQYHLEGDVLRIGVGQINSIETQLPFKYSYLSICQPPSEILLTDSLGELLTGTTISESLYEIKINKNEYCKHACTINITHKILSRINWLISHNYASTWYLDQLPAARGIFDAITNTTEYKYNEGIPIGITNKVNEENQQTIIYNHLTFKIQIHKVGEGQFEIVGFSVFPYTIQQSDEDNLGCKIEDNSKQNYPLLTPEQIVIPNENVAFTYDVIFEESNLTFVSRWDYYRYLNGEIHWFGIINSNLVILIFTFVVIFIFTRALKKDIEIYNMKVAGEDFIDEFGWKQVCNDVFRKPVRHMLLSSIIGTGVQLFLMLFLSLFMGLVGVLRPESRGNLITLMILLFVFMGLFGGYSSSRIYKIFNGPNWLKNALLTAVFYPGLVFLVFCIMNFFFMVEGSSATIRISDFLSLLVLWLCCSSPLVLIGAFLGIKRKVIKPPCRINSFPTTIPPKPWYFRIKYLIWMTGLIPFG